MKNRYRVLAMLMLIVLCTVLLPIEAKAAQYSLSLNPDGESFSVVGYRNMNPLGQITIPSSFNGKPVTGIGDRAFADCTRLTSVVIPESVTSIGAGAFKNCTNLEKVTMPNSIASIGEDAFYNCPKLSYNKYDNARYLGNDNNPYVALMQATSTNIRSCKIHDETKVIYHGAFKDNVYLSSVVIPHGVASIGAYAFNHTSLESITIPDSVTSIDNGAFQYCLGLSNVTLSDSVTTIGLDAFRDCNKLTNVTMGKNVTSIGAYAFYGCTMMKNIVLPETLIYLEHYAFYNCDGLTSITIPGSLKNIERYAFYDCDGLTRVTISDGVTNIGEEVFSFCENLTSVTIGKDVAVVEDSAFYGCRKLTEVYISDLSAWCRIDFHSGTSSPLQYGSKLYLSGGLVTDLVIPKGISSIGQYTFAYYNSLNSVTIPDSVTSIDKNAFECCSELTKILLPKEIDTIGEAAFYGCKRLKDVYHRGSKEDWNKIAFGKNNSYLLTATIIHDYAKTELPVVCRHNWLDATCISPKVCSLCGVSEGSVLEHSWTPATCTKPKTCSACGATTGSVLNHTYNSGVLTKPATCKDTGVKTYTCTKCGDRRDETVERLTSHTYDSSCDTACNICGQTRTVSHRYDESWYTDKNNHWYVCEICGNVKDKTTHIAGTPATEDTAQTCTICGYIITPALGHTHSFSSEVICNRDGHWYACRGCEEKKDFAPHEWENICDTVCDVCGSTRDITHQFSNEWCMDDKTHWHQCVVCGKKNAEEAHIPGVEATADTAQTCVVCGYEIAPALGTQETSPPATQPSTEADTIPKTENTIPAEGDKDKNTGESLDCIPVLCVVVAVVLIGTAVSVFVMKRKK